MNQENPQKVGTIKENSLVYKSCVYHGPFKTWEVPHCLPPTSHKEIPVECEICQCYLEKQDAIVLSNTTKDILRGYHVPAGEQFKVFPDLAVVYISKQIETEVLSTKPDDQSFILAYLIARRLPGLKPYWSSYQEFVDLLEQECEAVKTDKNAPLPLMSLVIALNSESRKMESWRHLDLLSQVVNSYEWQEITGIAIHSINGSGGGGGMFGMVSSSINGSGMAFNPYQIPLIEWPLIAIHAYELTMRYLSYHQSYIHHDICTVCTKDGTNNKKIWLDPRQRECHNCHADTRGRKNRLGRYYLAEDDQFCIDESDWKIITLLSQIHKQNHDQKAMLSRMAQHAGRN